jgi:hypothetical protein
MMMVLGGSEGLVYFFNGLGDESFNDAGFKEWRKNEKKNFF